MRIRLALFAVLAVAAAAAPASAPAAPAALPTLHFTVFAHTDLPLGDVVWTGTRFLYNAENLGKLETSDATGRDFQPFASLDQGGEEMRCLPAPTQPAFWPAGIYCHTPDNRILRYSPDGSSVTELARLPEPGPSDGALAFDTVGRFGYTLLAVSGGSASNGGTLYSIRKGGQVTPVGAYPGPGGADNIVVAPRSFGSQGGSVVITIDQDAVSGRVLAVDRHGTVTELASGLSPGTNPIAVIAAPPAKRAAGLPGAGLYLADTNSNSVYFTPAAGLKAYAGAVIVGTEKTARLWLVRPRAGGGFQTLVVNSDLSPTQNWNLESAEYVP
jgi:hypothetical protein